MTAILFITGLAADSRLRLGGLTLVQRALLVARRAGVRRCLVAGANAPLAKDTRFPRITPVVDAADACAVLRSEGATRVLCLQANVVTTPDSLARFAAAAGEGGVVALHAVPVAVVAAEAVETVWPVFLDSDVAGLDQLDPPGGLVQIRLPHALFAWARQVEQMGTIERQLLLSLENPRDGRVDTLFNRRLSRPLSRVLLRLPLTPNHITFLSFLSALLGGFSFARGTYGAGLLGAALFQLAAVLDCCDGEVARVKFQESPLGDALDISLDTGGNIAVFLGIARGAWLTGALTQATTLGWAVGIGILGTFPLVTYAERALPEPATSAEHRLAQRLVAALTSRDFTVLVFLAAVTATLPWFLWGAAVGANLFWITLAILLWRGRR